MSIAKAMVAIQKELKDPTRNRTVKIPTKSGAEFSYQYADLDQILDIARPVLNKHGVSIFQSPRDAEGDVCIDTVLLHEGGDRETSTIRLKVADNDPKTYGSTFTYARRYAIMAMLGMVAEDDTDTSEIGSTSGSTNKPGSTPNKYAGVCSKCGDQVAVEQGIYYFDTKETRHVNCEVASPDKNVDKSAPQKDLDRINNLLEAKTVPAKTAGRVAELLTGSITPEKATEVIASLTALPDMAAETLDLDDPREAF
jgi:hypothetical protein